MVEMKGKPELILIQNEIERLESQSSNGSLTLEDVRKLEILIKTRQLVLGEPTTITGNSEAPKKVSDKAVLSALKPTVKKRPVKKVKNNAKTSKKPGK